jgi:hypothetical protein
LQTSTSALKDCTTVRVSRSRASTEWAISGASIANRTAISATVTTRLSANVKVMFLFGSISAHPISSAQNFEKSVCFWKKEILSRFVGNNQMTKSLGGFGLWTNSPRVIEF